MYEDENVDYAQRISECCGGAILGDHGCTVVSSSENDMSDNDKTEFTDGDTELHLVNFEGSLTVNPTELSEDVNIKLDCDINESEYSINDELLYGV